LTYFQTRGEAEHSHFHIKSMKNSRRFTQINRFLRFGSGVALISAAAAMALVAVKPSSPLSSGVQARESTENGMVSAAFAKHYEDLFAARVGESAESPASYAEQMYELNGGDSITANDVLGAQAAASAISSIVLQPRRQNGEKDTR